MSLGGGGMVLALLADVLIIRRFGFTAVTDAIVVALTMPRLIGTVGRDATKFSLMTVFIQVEKEEGGEAFADLGVRVFNLFLGIGFVLMMAGLLLAGPIVSVVGWGLEPQGQALAATLLRLASGIAVFALGSAVLEVMLNSHKHFTVTALRNAVTPFVVIVTTLVTWRIEQAPYWIAGAYTAGYAIYYLMLMINATGKLGFKPDPTRLPNRQTFTKLRGTIGYPLTGFGVRQMARVAERTIASLGPTGSVTAYYCAYRLLAAIQNIVGVSVALTGQPKLTEHDLAGERSRFRAALKKRIGLILLISVPASAVLMLLSGPIIGLLYGHGGMDPQGLKASAAVLFVLGPAVIFYCLTPVLNSALYAQKRYGAVLYNMCLAAGSNVVLAFVLFKWLGLTGVAWAATIAAVLSVLNLLWLVTRTSQPETPESHL
jgi:putative peptidoglycan lipid II flippase